MWAETDTGVIIGADAIGELRKMSEAVGKEAAQKLMTELSVKPTVDIFLADMLIPYMALAQGKSVFLARTISEHIESNIWLMEKMLNVKFTHPKSKQPLPNRKKLNTMPRPSVCIKVPKSQGEKTINVSYQIWARRQIT